MPQRDAIGNPVQVLPAQVGTNRANFLYDGNSNNRAHYGTFYCNLNNTVSNANWNYDVAQSYPLWF